MLPDCRRLTPLRIRHSFQSSLLKLIKEDYRRRQLTAAEVRLEDILGDIEANPIKFTVASSLTDDRQWLHFVAQQGAPRPLRRLVESGADVHARDAVRGGVARGWGRRGCVRPPR